MKISQSDMILRHLARGKALTPLQALTRFGCFRLGARVWELKERGFKIVKKMVKVGGKRVAKYSLP